MDQVSLPLDGLPPDPDVEAAHDGDGEVEGHHGTQDGHHPVCLHELDVALAVRDAGSLNVLPHVYGDDPHDAGQAPRPRDHQQSLRYQMF